MKLQFGLQQDIPVDPMNLDLLHQINMRGNHYIDWMEYHAEWINIWKNKHSDVLARQWVEGIVTHTPAYMEWYRKNTTLFLSVAQQLHDPRTTITHNVAGSGVEQTHFEIPHPQSMYCTPSPIHQTFGQTGESVSVTSHEWMIDLFGVDFNTQNSAASYLATLQQFDEQVKE